MRKSLAILTMVAAMVGQAAAETGYKGYEMPPYQVELTDGARELRSYGPHLLAEVTVSGDRSGAASSGFRILAGYIFGRNGTGEKIAMTVPVGMEPQGDQAGKTWNMTFMMPEAFPRERLPTPDDARIRFVDEPGGRMVVERFSGWPGEEDLWARTEALRTWAEGQGLKVTGAPRFFFYDAPMTLPWRRRNEVALPVE